jgi:hypothetical protein
MNENLAALIDPITACMPILGLCKHSATVRSSESSLKLITRQRGDLRDQRKPEEHLVRCLSRHLLPVKCQGGAIWHLAFTGIVRFPQTPCMCGGTGVALALPNKRASVRADQGRTRTTLRLR